MTVALVDDSAQKAQLRGDIAADRVAGMRYKQIAAKYGISVPMVRHHLRHAVDEGLADPDRLHFHQKDVERLKQPEGEYNAWWVRKVLDSIKITDAGCWIFQGFAGEWGYCRIYYRGRSVAAHRQVYQVMHGAKLDRWQLVMHSCDMPACVNPVHLSIGTPADNVLDAASKGRHHNARKTHCKRGHEFTPENTFFKPDGARGCRTCRNDRNREQWHADPELRARRVESRRQRNAAKKARSALEPAPDVTGE